MSDSVADSTATSGSTVTSSGAPSGRPVVVELLDPGAEPRTELRFTPDVGATVQQTVRQEQTQRISIAGETQELSTVVKFDVTLEVEDVADNEITVRTVYEDARVVEADAATRPGLEQITSAFDGVEAITVFDDRGQIVSAEQPDVDLSADPVAAQLVEGLENQLGAFAVPFPERAVGPGAQWAVTSAAEFGGILTTEQRIVITLDEIDGAEAVTSNDVTIDFTGVEGGEVEVVSSELAGTGTTRFQLDRIGAFGEQTVEGTIVFEAQGQRIEQFQTQRIVTSPR